MAINTVKVKNASNISSNLSVELNDARVSSGTKSNRPTSGEYGDIYIETKSGVFTNNGWKYVYRAPNVVECWKEFVFSGLAITTSWSGCYAGDAFGTGKPFTDISILDYPVTFKTKPAVTFGMRSTGSYDFWIYYNQGSISRAPTFSGARGSSGTVAGVVYMHVIGEV